MDERKKKVYDAIVDEYGDDPVDLMELVSALLDEYPDASDARVVDYIVVMLEESDGNIDISDWVRDYGREWGRK